MGVLIKKTVKLGDLKHNDTFQLSEDGLQLIVRDCVFDDKGYTYYVTPNDGNVGKLRSESTVLIKVPLKKVELGSLRYMFLGTNCPVSMLVNNNSKVSVYREGSDWLVKLEDGRDVCVSLTFGSKWAADAFKQAVDEVLNKL